MTLRDSVLASVDKLWLLAANDPQAVRLAQAVHQPSLI